MDKPTNSNLSTNSPSNDLSKDDILDILTTDEQPESEETAEKEKPKKESKPEDEKSEGDEEQPEDEIKLKDEDEQPELEDEEIDYEIQLKRQDVLKKYPTLFKDFPQLEKAYYKAQQFAEVVPTLEDAKEAVSKAQQFDNFERHIFTGNIDEILKVVKQNDQRVYSQIVDNYLPNLAKVDPQAYYHILGNVFRNAVVSMTQEAKKQNNESLEEAATLLNQFIFGNSEITSPQPFSKPVNPEINEAERRIQERERKFVEGRFNTVHEDLNSRVNNILKSTITEHIDPKQSMTEYVRKTAIKDTLESTQDIIAQDTQFRKSLDNLWRKAFDSDFSRKSVDAIRSAYLAKARAVLPDIIKKTRIEALKGSVPNRSGNNEVRRTHLPVQRTASGKSEKAEIPPKMSTLDYFMQD